MTSALSLRNLRKTYSNGVVALKGIDLEVAQGDFFALLGPNGAGKSTIIGIISSLVNKTDGELSIFGHNIERDSSRAKSCLGVVPQEFNFNMFEPVEEILINQAGFYGVERSVAVPRAERYLRQLGLWEKRRAIARSLSGGMKRRLMIARALMHEPRLLILDEPTAGVDIEIRISMWKFLRELNAAGTTIILTTHYLEEAESLCRNIAIIDHGMLIENTSMKNLIGKLNTESFVLDVACQPSVLPSMPGVAFHIVDEHTLEIEVTKGSELGAIFSGLSSCGVEVRSMRNKTNRLEQLFLGLIGRREQGDL